MPVQLEGARERVADLMSGACRIARDHPGLSDAVLDLDTYALTQVTGETTQVYAGPCLVTHGGGTPASRESLGVEEALNRYTLHIPWNAPDVQKGDHCVVTASGDSTLISKRFVLTSVVRTDLLVWREASMQILETDRG